MFYLLRRSNIDIFWIWGTATVKVILGCTEEIVRRTMEGGRLVPLPEINSWPASDKVVMGVSIQMLEKSLDKVRN